MKLNDDVIDSRDIEERIVELEKNNNLTDQEKEELNQLAAIKKDVEDYSDEWQYGITFISEYHWVEYCEDCAYEMGYIEDIERVNSNPLVYCVDWEKWAKEMKYDYTSTEINKVDYYFRQH